MVSVLANLGGLSKFVLTFLGILSSFINDKLMQAKFLRGVYFVKGGMDKDGNTEKILPEDHYLKGLRDIKLTFIDKVPIFKLLVWSCLRGNTKHLHHQASKVYDIGILRV